MEFRTVIEPLKCEAGINHNDIIVMMGSCFTENVGNRLRMSMFDVEVNPFGVSFNPMSISAGVRRLISGKEFTADDLFLHNGVWNSFMHHSSFSHSDFNATLDGINDRLAEGHNLLSQARYLILTWGTAYVFRDTGSQMVVNNCHKLPSSRFSRLRLNVAEIVADYKGLIAELQSFNPDLKIVITVSPVRHLADGLAGNQVGKSILRIAADELSTECDAVSYFPSYEIVIDDLRDYRFCAADMVHPTDVATDYVYKYFLDNMCSPEARVAANECERLWKRLSHRIMTDNAEVAEQFRRSTEDAINTVVERYPYIKNRVKRIYDESFNI